MKIRNEKQAIIRLHNHPTVKEIEMNRVDHHDYTLDDIMPQQPVNARPSFKAIMTFATILAVATTVLLRGSIYSMTQAVLTKQQEAEALRQQREAKAARKTQLQAKLTLVAGKLSELEEAINKFSTQFESVTRIPLNHADVMNTRKTNRLKLQSDSFLITWTHIMNGRVPAEMLINQKEIISEVGEHIDHNTHESNHVSSLDDVLTWIKGQHQTLQSQWERLDQISASLI